MPGHRRIFKDFAADEFLVTTGTQLGYQNGRGGPAGDRGHVTSGLLADEVANAQPDVTRDCAQECGRDVAAWMKRHGSHPSVGVAVLLVRPSLANLYEPESLQQGHHLA